MIGVFVKARKASLTFLGINKQTNTNDPLPYKCDGVGLVKNLQTKGIISQFAALQIAETYLPNYMDTPQPVDTNHLMDVESSVVTSQAGSLTSLNLSDSEEESGYMSCTSGGKKPCYSKDIENLLANHSDSSKSSNGSLNDLSSYEHNDSQNHGDHDEVEVEEDDKVDCGECCIISHGVSSADMTSAGMPSAEITSAEITSAEMTSAEMTSAYITSTEMTSAETKSPEPQVPEEQLEENSEVETASESDGEEDMHTDNFVTKGDTHVQNLNNEQDDEEEEVGEDVEDDEVEGTQKPYTGINYSRQITIASTTTQDNSAEDSSGEEGDDVQFPEKKHKPKRARSRDSSGTWISDDNEEKCGGVTLNGDDSDGPEIGDFFDGIADDITYTFQDDDNENVSTYPSKDFFHYGRSSPIYGPHVNVQEIVADDDDNDDDEDYTYLFSSDLKTGKRYAFPRREPRTITDAVDFWETDFEVKGCIYPCMSSWEQKELAPTYEEDVEDYMKFKMYKSLYEKWVKCNRSREQWAQRYWGRSIEYVARMKGPSKRPMSSSQSDSAINYTPSNKPQISCGAAEMQSVAERRRKRRNEATRWMY